MAEAAVPFRESVGGALRFARGNWRFVATVAGLFAIGSTLVSMVTLSAPQLVIVTMVANGLIQAFSYGALVAGALFGTDVVRSRWSRDGWRVWSSMAVVGFFLLLVMLVVSIPVAIILAAGPLAPYAEELQRAGDNQQAVLEIATRFVEGNPVAVLLVTLFYGAVWFLLTSRLYLAAPASLDAGRTLTFETWNWTRGAALRITWARAMLLFPAYVFMFAVTALLGRLFGFDVMSAASLQNAVTANPAGVIIFEFISSFLVLALYASLEAGLSSYLYRGMKPAGVVVAEPGPIP